MVGPFHVKLTTSQVIKAGVSGLRRILAGNEADFQCLRLDDNARDMALDKVAVWKGGRELPFHPLQQDACGRRPHDSFDLRSRNVGDAACFGLAILQNLRRLMRPALAWRVRYRILCRM